MLFLFFCMFLVIIPVSLAVCTDTDGDGFGNPGDISCTNGSRTDCNNNNASIYPGAVELCDLLDNDCDGGNNEGHVCNCSASDGFDPRVYGTLTSGYNCLGVFCMDFTGISDWCNGPTRVVEYGCDLEGRVVVNNLNCTYGCSGGACEINW